MDTRSKILTPAAAREIAVRPIATVTGTFDVLRAAHARALREVRQDAPGAALLVIVLPGSGGVLPQRARAELVAALRAVDYVVAVTSAEIDGLIDVLGTERPVRMEGADEKRLLQLREQVRSAP